MKQLQRKGGKQYLLKQMMLPQKISVSTGSRGAFTLLELLIVVALVAILSAIAVTNLALATQRSLKSADAANLRTLATGLQLYLTDYNELPPADREAGPFPSHLPTFSNTGNGPAAGGSWDGVPWLLVERGYVENWTTLFNPYYLREYSGGETIRGGHPRYHNFRYAYNSSGLASGGTAGGAGNVMSGETWIIRNLWVPPQNGWYGAQFPRHPADYNFPWGEGRWENKLEHVLYADLGVQTVIGGTDTVPTP
jgi:prepilin-type N-terminal cleavage/methylation domain-containing protein